MGLLTSLAGVAVQTWTIQNAVVDGMTPSQQITNAVTQAANGDTILFKLGTYQLDDASFMQEETSGTITRRSYVYLTNKALNFVGESDGKWSDGVVLRGNGRERFFFINNNDGSTFRNLTFENFCANNDATVVPGGGETGGYAVGGAGFFAIYRDVNVLSNCVFRDNVARTGGAVGCANAFDCMFTNNVAKKYGGAAFLSRLAKCSCLDNKATESSGVGGAVHLLREAVDSVFVGNQASDYGGCFVGSANAVVSNCVFRENKTTNGTQDYYGGGVMVLDADSVIKDSRFVENSTMSLGGVVRNTSGYTGDGSIFEKCIFEGNSSSGDKGGRGGVVYDMRHAAGQTPLRFVSCMFVSNRVDNTKANDTTQSCAVGYCGSYSNCVFVGNSSNKGSCPNGIISGTADAIVPIVDCVFSNNFNRMGGMVRYANITNTLFWGNEVPREGGVVKRCSVVDCQFVGNRARSDTYSLAVDASSPSGDATESTLVKCDMDLGCIVNSVLVDCHIHTLSDASAKYVFYGHNVATNCLIENCRPLADQNRGLIYRFNSTIPAPAYIDGSDYVNCTFADNVFPYILHHPNEYGVYTPFKNCLFYNNKNQSGKLIDAYYKVKDVHGDLSNLDSGFALSNCVVGASVESAIAGDTWQDLGGNKVIAPDSLYLAGAKAEELGVNKYSPLLKSSAVGMGDASMFTATDLDYAGNLRLRGGQLDAGCFQCWLRSSGMILFVR